ncbi:MAG: OsmC family protein [Proteobacteria bacterium]|jgi:putative redox protein|nr:OsmC family protein [Pseudomonadota bacterium]
MKSEIKWTDKMHFSAKIRHHEHGMDAKAEFGGEDSAPSPKELLLSSIAGCTAMDVVSLMKKMRVDFKTFRVSAEADTTESHPRVFKVVHLKFYVDGENPDLEKIKKSVEMSLTKYCGVSAMVSKVSPLDYEILINNQVAATGKAKFEI